MNWTPDRIKKAKALWQKGKSATDIGKAIGMSKSAVLGKIHRLGAAERPVAKKASAKKIIKTTKKIPAKKATAKKTTPKKIVQKVTPKKVIKAAPKKMPKPTPKKIVKIVKKPEPKKGQKQPTKPTAKPVPVAKTVVKPVAKITPQPEEKITTPKKQDRGLALSLMDLKLTSCRWPIGDPSDKDFCFCGKTIQTGKPYCPDHCKEAYISLRELTLQNAKNKREKAKVK